MSDWQPIETAPNGRVVETKIDDAGGVRNVARLKRHNNLWFFSDDSMYVYYQPTHWRECNPPFRKLTQEEKSKIDELAMYFFEGSGDVQAVSWSLRNVILARFEWVAQHGKDSGE